ncbi:MAG: right-handed parallel beta-helix repeat-containing protein [Candidatus Korobacteraceae bacterium]
MSSSLRAFGFITVLIAGSGAWFTASPQAATPPASVNITSFGAKGDGVTDDTEAMKAALRATAPQGTLICPGSSVYIITTVTVPSQITISGTCTIKQKDHTADRALLNIPNGSAGITIDGITIDGNRPNVSGNNANGIFVSNTSNITIKNVKFINIRRNGVLIAGGKGFTLANLTGANFGVAADHAIGSLVQAWQGASDLNMSNLHMETFYGIGLNITKVHNITLRDSNLSGSTMSSGMTIEGSTGVVLHNVTASNNFAHGFELTGDDGLQADTLVAEKNQAYNYLIGVFSEGNIPGRDYHITNLVSSGAGKQGVMIQGLIGADFRDWNVSDGITMLRDDRTQTRPSNIAWTDCTIDRVTLEHADNIRFNRKPGQISTVDSHPVIK